MICKTLGLMERDPREATQGGSQGELRFHIAAPRRLQQPLCMHLQRTVSMWLKNIPLPRSRPLRTLL